MKRGTQFGARSFLRPTVASYIHWWLTARSCTRHAKTRMAYRLDAHSNDGEGDDMCFLSERVFVRWLDVCATIAIAIARCIYTLMYISKSTIINVLACIECLLTPGTFPRSKFMCVITCFVNSIRNLFSLVGPRLSFRTMDGRSDVVLRAPCAWMCIIRVTFQSSDSMGRISLTCRVISPNYDMRVRATISYIRMYSNCVRCVYE